MAVINPDISGLWNPERLLEVVHRAWGSSKGFGPPRDKQRHRAHNSTLVYPSAGLKSHSGQNVVHCIAPKHCTSDFYMFLLIVCDSKRAAIYYSLYRAMHLLHPKKHLRRISYITKIQRIRLPYNP